MSIVEAIEITPATGNTRRRARQPIWMLEAAKVIPPSPPCFEARDIWVSYVLDSASCTDGDVPSILRAADGPRMNPMWSFCADCLPGHRERMCDAGRCKPSHLKDLT